MTNTIDTAELRKLADAMFTALGADHYEAAKASFHAAANPSTMLALLDRLEKQEARIAELEDRPTWEIVQELEARIRVLQSQVIAASQVEAEPVGEVTANPYGARLFRNFEAGTKLYAAPAGDKAVLSRCDAGSADAKEFTDAQILRIAADAGVPDYEIGDSDLIKFGRAAIAAAQEGSKNGN